MMSGIAPGRDDLIHPFQIESSGVRGRLVRLGPAIDLILRQHAYPDIVSRLLGEALALVSALGGMLKFDGLLTLQAKGNGPVGMLVADYRTPGDLRGYASFDATAVAALDDTGDLSRVLGEGYLAFTIDQGADMERYQGIVPIEDVSLGEAADRYFRQSEQLHAGFKLATGLRRDKWRATCLMLQRLPPEGPGELRDMQAEDDWRRCILLLDTVSVDELLDPDLPANDLLYRLFHEDGVRVYPTLPVQPRCRCDRERVMTVLKSFPLEEVREMTIDDGRIRVTCEFCSTHYLFDPADLGT